MDISLTNISNTKYLRHVFIKFLIIIKKKMLFWIGVDCGQDEKE